MPKKLKLFAAGTWPSADDELKLLLLELIKKCSQEWQKNRLLALSLAMQGEHTSAQIAKLTGMSRRQLFYLIKSGQSGVYELLRRRRGGRIPKINPSIKDEIRGLIYEKSLKTPTEIKEWLWKNHQIRIGVSGAHYYLKRLRISSKPPASIQTPNIAPEPRPIFWGAPASSQNAKRGK